MDYFVRSGSLIGFPEVVRGYDRNPSEMLRAVGLGTSILHNPDLYIPYTSLAQLLELAAAQCNAPDFGVRLASHQGLIIPGALGSFMCLQPNIAAALTTMQQNVDFHARGVLIDLTMQEEYFDIRMDFAFTAETPCEQLSSLSLGLVCRVITQMQENPIYPSKVQLTIDASKITPVYQQLFGSTVEANSEHNLIRYPTRLLNSPISISVEVREWMSKYWQHDLERAEPISLPLQVERAINSLLPTGECCLELIAKIIGMHPRVLQRKLKSEDTSFGELLNTCRMRLAYHNLKNSDIDLTTLSLNLGYADLPTFSRAFKKWTGKSPRRWRELSRKTKS